MTSIPYFGFIFAAYAFGAVVIAAMIASTLLDYRHLRQALERLAKRTGRGIDD